MSSIYICCDYYTISNYQVASRRVCQPNYCCVIRKKGCDIFGLIDKQRVVSGRISQLGCHRIITCIVPTCCCNSNRSCLFFKSKINTSTAGIGNRCCVMGDCLVAIVIGTPLTIAFYQDVVI